MILPDTPIENKDGDRLRRGPLAAKVGELISSFVGKESYVIGIEGIWGSGKTSFVNLVLANLDPAKTIVVPFNPWNFSGQNELISDFFATLVGGIEDFRSNKKYAKQIKGLVSKLTRKSEVSISPELSLWWGLASFKANDLFTFGGAEEKTLQEERAEVDRLFAALDKKVVVVIDDLDRLDKEETRLVMKMVKMTANFPNTVFLLAYDRAKVAERLTEEGWQGEEYLKKIVQVGFTLPEPDRQGLNDILFGDLDATITAVYGVVNIEGEDEQRWHKIGYEGFHKLFKTVRDIKRYISSLRLNWSIMGKDDINLVDFIAIEAIRVFAPSFYSAIVANKTLFTDTSGFWERRRGGGRGGDTKTTQYQELLQLVPEDIKQIIDGVTKEIFPSLDSGYSGGDWQQRWRVERRICADERFDFYFQLGVPVGAVSQTELDAAVTALGQEGAFSEVLLKFKEDKRLRGLLSKILDVVNTFDRAKTKALVLSMWNLEKTIDEERRAGFEFDDVESQSTRLPYHAIKNSITTSKEERGSFIVELLNETTTLFYPLRFVSVLGQELEKQGQNSNESLVNEVAIAEPQRILLKKIRDAAQSGTLLQEKHLDYILWRWADWANEVEPQQYVAELLKTREGLLTYLKGFVSKVFSSTGNYNRIQKKGLAKFVPQDTLDVLVAAITPEELATMTEKDKEAVELYRKPRDRWDD